jgi:hypothetical protein
VYRIRVVFRWALFVCRLPLQMASHFLSLWWNAALYNLATTSAFYSRASPFEFPSSLSVSKLLSSWIASE